MHRCTVTSCRKIRRKDPGIVLYTLPDGAEKDPVWLSVLKYGRPTRWAPKKSTRICSDHFKMCDMDGRKLLPKAIPFREPVVFHPLNTDHTYFKSEEHTVTEVQGLKNTIVKLSNNNTKLRGEKRKLKSDLESCEEAVNRLKTSINTSDEKFENILSKAKGVSLEIYNRLQKKT